MITPLNSARHFVLDDALLLCATHTSLPLHPPHRYYHFKPDKCYWIVYIILRKFCIAFAGLVFRGNPAFQLAIVLLVLFWSYMMQVQNRPYMSTGERDAVIRDLSAKAKKANSDPAFKIYQEIKHEVEKATAIAAKQKRKEGEKTWQADRRKSLTVMDMMEDGQLKRATAYFFASCVHSSAVFV